MLIAVQVANFLTHLLHILPVGRIMLNQQLPTSLLQPPLITVVLTLLTLMGTTIMLVTTTFMEQTSSICAVVTVMHVLSCYVSNVRVSS